MSDLVRALVIAGLVSGTQPLTIMGLLLVMAGQRPRRNGWAYVAGALVVETTVLLVADLVVGATVEPDTGPARAFLGIRIALGLALIVLGLLLRRPAKQPQPEVPKALERLQNMDPKKSFVAGFALADYQGPVIASLALAASDVSSSGRLLSIAFYTSLASGIPIALMLAITRSDRTRDRIDSGTKWVMRNRRVIASWICLVLGTFLAADATIGLLFVNSR
ncbi:MAG: GAP family protein [Actinobacteria bacterium]|nr:GAP family protein [Actinomycetota bacterium]